MLAKDELAPDFVLDSDLGEQVRLSDLRGKKVVLYFYPKDDTPGCTKEACSFRDDHAMIAMKGAVVVGISPDSVKSHGKFRAKYSLPFYLLSDPDHVVAAQYGAWAQKVRCGKVSEGIVRSTFVIDEEGRIAHVFPNVKPEGHAQEVLAVL